ncbi:MAG TPA: hypothetical protein VMH90_03190 [Thermoplasmata archaeon]|nr:hypothetical protein [Thermoplasmata archaeon]
MAPAPDDAPAPATLRRRRPAGFRRPSGAPRSLPKQTPRHLHRSGPHSLAVSLPKSWIDGHSLARGSVVWLRTRDDGRLEIGPANPEGPGSAGDRVLTVGSKHFGEPDVLARTVFGGYVVGYDRIELSDAAGFDPDRWQEVERTAHALVGLQVVHHDAHRVMLQSFVDAGRHSVPKVLARAGLLVEEMTQLLATSLRGESKVPLQELAAMEAESDRLYALALRQLMLAQGDPALARRLDVREPRDLLGGRVVGKVFEEIADLLCRAAPDLKVGLEGRELPAPLRSDLVGHVEALREMVGDSSRALQKEDSELAHRVLHHREDGLKALQRTEQLLAGARLPRRQTASLAIFAWALGTARRLCGTIAEVALNESIQSTTTG